MALFSPLRLEDESLNVPEANVISPTGSVLSPSVFQSPAVLSFTSPYRTPARDAQSSDEPDQAPQSAVSHQKPLRASNQKSSPWVKKKRGNKKNEAPEEQFPPTAGLTASGKVEETEDAPKLSDSLSAHANPNSSARTSAATVETPVAGPEPGFLMVRVLRVKGLPENPTVPFDSFCIVQIGSQSARTRMARGGKSAPTFDDMFDLMVQNNQQDKLEIKVMGKEVVGTEIPLGEAEFSLSHLRNFESQEIEKVLTATTLKDAAVKVRFRFVTLNTTMVKQKSQRELFFDKYGFTVSSREEYEEAIKSESSYSPEPPSLLLGTSQAALHGIGFPYKARYWQIFAMKHLQLKTSPFITGLYEKLSQEEGNKVLLSQIEKDLPRTFPNHPSFYSREGRDALGRILKAFSLKHPNIGYTQAMNFIAGFLLLLMEEELAFKVLTVLVEYFVPGYYSNTMAGLQADQAVLNHLVKEKLPRLWNHLKAVQIDLNVMTTKWFMCLFIHTLPFPSVLRIWDVLFCKGSAALILAALAILKINEEELLQKTDIGNSMEFPDHMCRNFYRWEEIIEHMYSLAGYQQVEALQKEARKKIDNRIRVRQIRDCESTNFSEDELLEILKKFELHSTNETVGKAQFVSLLTPKYEKLVTTDTRVLDRLYSKFDRNSDGVLDFREFCNAYSVLDRGTPEQKIRLILYVFDLDNDGFIGREDLMALLDWQYKSMEFSNIEEMVKASVQFAFSEYDLDKDEKLNFEEFMPVVFKQPYLVQLLRLVGDENDQ